MKTTADAQPPQVDVESGLLTYSTGGARHEGRLRTSFQDFQVQELMSLKDVVQVRAPGLVPVYKVTKAGVDTPHVAREIAAMIKSEVNFAGLKDKNATVVQYVSARSSRASAPAELSGSRFEAPACRLLQAGHAGDAHGQQVQDTRGDLRGHRGRRRGVLQGLRGEARRELLRLPEVRAEGRGEPEGGEGDSREGLRRGHGVDRSPSPGKGRTRRPRRRGGSAARGGTRRRCRLFSPRQDTGAEGRVAPLPEARRPRRSPQEDTDTDQAAARELLPGVPLQPRPEPRRRGGDRPLERAVRGQLGAPQGGRAHRREGCTA